MTHVQIAQKDSGEGILIVDGVDISMAVFREGLSLRFRGYDEPVEVCVVIAADTLDVDLPDAVLASIRAEESD